MRKEFRVTIRLHWAPMSFRSSHLDASNRLGRHSSVLGLICHYRREHWLAQCIESLVTQTRPPDNIVVVDDASPQPPVDIVRRFPQVTLLVAPENVGMWRLTHQVVANTDYDAYMFQDSDDWSAPERLAALLDAAESTSAEMVGCQEHRIYEGVSPRPPVEYPLDGNLAICLEPSIHPVLSPSSVVSRRLVHRLGGFANGLRYCGDTEFIRRAVFVAQIVSIPEFYYHRRVHPDALTVRPETGHGSPLRRSIHERIMERWNANCQRILIGQAPDLSPFPLGPPILLDHALGPFLRPAPPELEAPQSEPSSLELGLLRRRLQMGLELSRMRKQLQEERYRTLVERVRNDIYEAVPQGATVAIVSKGDPALLNLNRRNGLHFTQGTDGVYDGHHPKDSQEAARYLEEALREGAQFLVLPQTVFWWLEHYDGFRRHLESHYQRIWDDVDCIIYRLETASDANI